MDKEFEELKNIVIVHFGALGFLNPSENEQILKDRDKVLNALTELKQIKEANSSEAMDKLEGLGFGLWNEDKSIVSINGHYFKNAYDTIKQSLLKAQEQDKENAEYKEVLRIIFEKNIDIDIIKNCQTVIEYNWNTRFERYQCKELTEEEFNTVKRWRNG